MDCKKTKALIDEYSRGCQLEEAGVIEAHLASCESCARELREHSEMTLALAHAPRYKAPAGFSSRVMERIGNEETAKEPGLFRWLWSMPAYLKAAEAAAAVLVVAMGVLSAGLISGSLGGGQAAEAYTELASLEELEMVPPGSMGDMYLSMKENGNEQ